MQKKQKKQNSGFAAIFMAAVMIFTAALNGFAFAEAPAETDTNVTVKISDKREWLEFAKRCRLDSYSAGLSAELTGDIDLTGEENACIPIFCGSFNGGGFTVSIKETNVKTDTMGLFRIVGSDAVIKDLRVNAEIVCPKKNAEAPEMTIPSEIGELKPVKLKPDSDKNAAIGILCGENRGCIQNCVVSGSLTGCEGLGGIAGVNKGTIKSCSSFADTDGTYNVGGIAGVNYGEIRFCLNGGSINTSPNEKATNIGGIAGINENIVTNCENRAEIGYLHTGYNVGGITGLNRGFVRRCKNFSDIFGRRDVGGIIGQKEPFLRLEYGENMLEILDNSINGFSSALNEVMDNLQTAMNNGAEGLEGIISQFDALIKSLSNDISSVISQEELIKEINVYIERIRNEIEYIKANLTNDPELLALLDEIEQLLDELEQGNISEWPQLIPELIDKLNELYSHINDYSWLRESLERISESAENLISTIMNGLADMGNQITAIVRNLSRRLSKLSAALSEFIEQTGSNAGSARESIDSAMSAVADLQNSIKEFMEGSQKKVEDISKDINAQEKGMTVSCENSGNVSADYNVGGIIGNLSTELTFDQEETEVPAFEELAFADTILFMRATVYKCKNSGNINSKYDYTGGILGYGTRGALIECENSGNIASGRNNAGGIAGYFRGAIQTSCSMGALKGEAYIGGIAGDAAAVENCMAIPVIDAEGAYMGAVAGYAETLDNINGNLFVNDELGGINGISYAGRAEALSYNELKKAAGADFPNSFRSVTVYFNVEGEPLIQFSVPYGTGIENLPVVEQKDGKYWRWNEFDSENIRCNRIIDGEWKNLITTLSTGEEPPLFLAEGKFDENAYFTAENLLPDTGETADTEPATEAPGVSGFNKFLVNIGLLKYNLTADTPEPSSYKLNVTGSAEQEFTFRYLTEADGKLYSLEGNEPTELPYTRDGRYIVFKLKNNGSFLFEPNQNKNSVNWLMLILIAGGIILLIAVIIIIPVVKHKKRKKIYVPETKNPSAAEEGSEPAEIPANEPESGTTETAEPEANPEIEITVEAEETENSDSTED